MYCQDMFKIVYFFVFSLAHLLFLPFLIVIFHSYYYSHIFLYYGDMLPPLKSLILKWGLLAQWLY